MSYPVQNLLDWFAQQQRTLPWRGPFPRDPFRVLVSEVMLQQTQVDRVIPGFHRFLARFPTLAALAAASADEAVEAFSGMGYYGRARRLHQAARCIVARGEWPRDARTLGSLPGFGRYTSAAVSAFAFAGDDPPVDGNVARVAARLLARSLPAGGPRLLREASDLARELHAADPRPEVFEALMELGATVCTPRSPRCGRCPLASCCRGRAAPDRFPLPRPAKKAVDVVWVSTWLQDHQGRVLLRRVSEGGLLAGLWLPPLAVVGPGLAISEAAAVLAAACAHTGRLVAADPVRHAITHHRIVVHPFVGSLPAASVYQRNGGLALCDPGAPGLPTSSLLAKLGGRCSGAFQRSFSELWSDPHRSGRR